MLALPLVPRQFFPSSDRPELLVDLRLPQDASIYASSDASAKIDAMLKADPDVAHWSTNVGRGAIRFYLPLNVELPNDFFSQFVVIAKDMAARDRLRAKLERMLAEDFPGAVSPGRSAGTRAAGRLAGAIPRQRPGHHEVREIAFAWPRSSPPMPARGGSISTGSNRGAKSACASIRIRRGCWA